MTFFTHPFTHTLTHHYLALISNWLFQFQFRSTNSLYQKVPKHARSTSILLRCYMAYGRKKKQTFVHLIRLKAGSFYWLEIVNVVCKFTNYKQTKYFVDELDFNPFFMHGTIKIQQAPFVIVLALIGNT